MSPVRAVQTRAGEQPYGMGDNPGDETCGSQTSSQNVRTRRRRQDIAFRSPSTYNTQGPSLVFIQVFPSRLHSFRRELSTTSFVNSSPPEASTVLSASSAIAPVLCAMISLCSTRLAHWQWSATRDVQDSIYWLCTLKETKRTFQSRWRNSS